MTRPWAGGSGGVGGLEEEDGASRRGSGGESLPDEFYCSITMVNHRRNSKHFCSFLGPYINSCDEFYCSITMVKKTHARTRTETRTHARTDGLRRSMATVPWQRARCPAPLCSHAECAHSSLH